MELLSIVILRLRPAFWSRDMIIYLVSSAFLHTLHLTILLRYTESSETARCHGRYNTTAVFQQGTPCSAVQNKCASLSEVPAVSVILSHFSMLSVSRNVVSNGCIRIERESVNTEFQKLHAYKRISPITWEMKKCYLESMSRGISYTSISQTFFQVGTTFISQNVLRTTLLLGLSNSLDLP